MLLTIRCQSAGMNRPTSDLTSCEGAVYREHRPGHPLRVVRCEEQRRPCNVFGRADARPWSEVVEQLVGLFFFKERPHHRSRQEPRADGIYVDALGREVQRQFASQVDDSTLGRTVSRLERQTDETTDGCNVDDAAANLSACGRGQRFLLHELRYGVFA